ncbi:DNA-binding response regulator, NarL/FixJ family, contains REC and HTH domains [Actinopolyspora mzabensis]|uniref:DNA-binding response regulator, NarL/FixJ family, contains REC and HTH domains n=1 Tax=Actinopolyspora mzabensis TaxID=995066 RepID=A0A1G8X463_ACTMZ|nr:response regulator transcription factor [Actinopolyspora mzabensis]SDJ85137.1 DNA-binding response regulator, NarL/FixJ family, contains REC and HTH domains [Actinopolyspora mzabensis]
MPSIQAGMPPPADPTPRNPTGNSTAAGHDAHTRARKAVESVTRSTVAADGVLRVVHGAERIGNTAHRLQRGASSLVRGVVKPPYAATEPLDTLERHKLAEGVEYRVLYDRAALARPPQLETTTRLMRRGEQARVVQFAPTKLLVVDDEFGLLPLTGGPEELESAVLVRDSAMLTALIRVFDDLWRPAAPVRESAASAESDVPTDEERWILSLLASGATDDTIGRLMGFSSRTAHRRVRELVTKLGVETRFQAGVRAVKLGWL